MTLLATLVLGVLVLPCAAADTGTIKGTITRGGMRPGPVEHAVVSVDGPRTPAVPEAPHAIMDQRGRKFVPHVLAVPVGTTVEFPNHDPFVHNVHSTGPTNAFDLGMYLTDEMRSATFDEPGVSEIRCNVHPEMRAFVFVHTNPHAVVTDRSGRYTISGIPPGGHSVRVWHPEFQARPTPVTVRGGEVMAVDFELTR